MDTKEDVAVKIEKDTNDYLNQLEKTVPEHKEQVIASTIQINNLNITRIVGYHRTDRSGY